MLSTTGPPPRVCTSNLLCESTNCLLYNMGWWGSTECTSSLLVARHRWYLYDMLMLGWACSLLLAQWHHTLSSYPIEPGVPASKDKSFTLWNRHGTPLQLEARPNQSSAQQQVHRSNEEQKISLLHACACALIAAIRSTTISCGLLLELLRCA